MSLLIRFKLFLDEIEQTKYYRVVAVVIGITVLMFAFLFYMHSNKIASLQKELKAINRERQKARVLLEFHNQVEQQQNEVQEVLAQDKTFKIKEYFSRLLAQLGLQMKLAKDTETSDPQDLNNGYSEIKLDANFTAMSMQDLVKLLHAIEADNRRIYIKDLDITKAAQGNEIVVTLVIATLQPNVRA